MAAGDVKLAYSASSAFTITLDTLVSSTTNTVGVESTAIDNTANLFLDAMVRVTVVSGAAVANDKAVYVYAYGSADGTNYTSTATGTAAAITIEQPTQLRLIGVVPIGTTATTYKSHPFSVAAAFGGILPQKWGLVVINNSGANLATTGNSAGYAGVYATVATA